LSLATRRIWSNHGSGVLASEPASATTLIVSGAVSDSQPSKAECHSYCVLSGPDSLHFNAGGYEKFTSAVRPVLMEKLGE